jgi:hypothetical protein
MSDHATPQHLIDRVRAAAADRTPLAITGGGTKAFSGEPLAAEPLQTKERAVIAGNGWATYGFKLIVFIYM